MSHVGSTIAVVMLLLGCGSRAAPPSTPPPPVERFTGSFSPPPARDAEVVATVNGERIYAADVARQASARGLDARQALAELIDAELLAGEARRRGLTEDREVVEVRRREEVRALLRRDFEPTFDGPEDVPQAEVEAVYNLPSIRLYYDHEVAHTVAYVRATVKKKAPPADDAAARAAAQAFHDAAVAARPASKDDFLALGRKLAAGKLEAADTQVFTTTRTGPAVKAFADAAFTLGKPGDLSAPTKTDWGWDVLYLVEIVPARHATREEAYADIRVKRFEASRRLAFMRWVDGLMAGKRIARDDALLDRVQVDSLVAQ